MKPRKRHLTARIKPATKHALMAQLALAADEIIEERSRANDYADEIRFLEQEILGWERWMREARAEARPWWRRLLGLR